MINDAELVLLVGDFDDVLPWNSKVFLPFAVDRDPLAAVPYRQHVTLLQTIVSVRLAQAQ